jgi:hypothetical protein
VVKTPVLHGLAAASCLWVALAAGAWAQDTELVPVPSDFGQVEAPADSPVPGEVEYLQAESDLSEFPGSVVAGNPWGPEMLGGVPCEPTTGCCENCGRGRCCPACGYLEGGVRLLTRNAPRHAPLVYEAFDRYGLTRSPVFSTRDLDYNIAPGLFVTLGRYLGRNVANYDEYLEIGYWGLNQWDNTDYVDSAEPLHISSPSTEFGNLFTPFFPEIGGFNRVSQVTFDTRHSVNNVEFSYWLRPRARADRLVMQENGRWAHQCQPGWYWSHMFGLRAMFIGDDFGMHTQGNIVSGTTSTSVSGDYLVQVNNNLFGLQAGGNLMFQRCRASWGFRYRVAPFINVADQDSLILSSAGADPLATRGNFNLRREASNETAAVALELGVFGTYQLLPRLIVKGGYDIMWIPGVALAPDQLDFSLDPDPHFNSSLANLNSGATLFYQGLTFSAEFTW